jgi:hypothetical protein
MWHTVKGVVMTVIAQDATQRIILTGMQWCTYEQLLQERGDHHTVHMTYDRGTLEFMAPSFSHEHVNRILAMIVEAVARAALTYIRLAQRPLHGPTWHVALSQIHVTTSRMLPRCVARPLWICAPTHLRTW